MKKSIIITIVVVVALVLIALGIMMYHNSSQSNNSQSSITSDYPNSVPSQVTQANAIQEPPASAGPSVSNSSPLSDVSDGPSDDSVPISNSP